MKKEKNNDIEEALKTEADSDQPNTISKQQTSCITLDNYYFISINI